MAGSCSAGGAMFAVQAREDEVAPMLGHDVSIAAADRSGFGGDLWCPMA